MRLVTSRITNRIVICLFGLALLLPAASGQEALTADLLLRNGAVYTVDPRQPWAEAVAVRGEKILAVGRGADLEKFRGRRTRVVDLAGMMVLPGFHDSHMHLLEGGVELGQCRIDDCDTPEEVFAAVGEYAARQPRKPWIVGGGWELPVFPGGNPTREELDRVVPDRPAYLVAADGHSAWLNSRALALAGITAATPDPKDGRIERRPGGTDPSPHGAGGGGFGQPSGTLRESAMDLVSEVLPPTTTAEMRQGLRVAQAEALRHGITSVNDARTDEEFLKVYADFVRRGELQLEVWASVPADPDEGPGQVADLLRLQRTYEGGRLRVRAVKIFADGVIEAHTAALLEPYADRPGERGTPVLDGPAFDALAVALDRAGFQIHVHAIGDRGIRLALDALEAARKANGPGGRRHQLAHIELIDPADLPRFARLGVAADFQPLWAYADPYIVKLTEPVLGPVRSDRLYQIGSMVRSGALVVAGSDWTVTSMNPLEAIQVAVTRQDPEHPGGQPWLPDERIDLPTAIAAYTINGARLNRQDDVLGSITPGKKAHLAVLDRNLFEIPPEEISHAEVRMTIIDGKVVYSAPPARRGKHP